MKNYLLYFAMFFLSLCLGFSGNEDEVRWVWADLPHVPLIFMIISLICIALHLYKEGIREK